LEKKEIRKANRINLYGCKKLLNWNPTSSLAHALIFGSSNSSDEKNDDRRGTIISTIKVTVAYLKIFLDEKFSKCIKTKNKIEK
jgi:hypothetical protein